MTLQGWATARPDDFVATAITELDGTSEIGDYGAPYIDTPGPGRRSAPISPAGLRRPSTSRIDTAQDYVINPLSTVPLPFSRLMAALT